MDDTHQALAEIRARHQKSIVSMLIDIQQHTILQEKTFGCIERLDCLYVKKSSRKRYHLESVHESVASEPRIQGELGRAQINGFQRSDYVAVSYTWNPSGTEDKTGGGYIVESRDSYGAITSKVRDCVFDRVINYLRYVNSDLFWIDKEGINQEDREEKAAAVEVMDLVYSHSRHSVALLSTSIDTLEDFSILIKILRGELVRDQESGQDATSNTSQENFWKAVQLLKRITSDSWWTRAWTFQEDYRAATKMTLLIPHSRCLEAAKRDADDLLGNTTGELCISSVTFREQATKLCRLTHPGETEEQTNARNFVLKKAAEYKTTLRETDLDGNHTIRRSMSPYIIADIGDRKLEDPWDRLPITSNSCYYPTRMNIKSLAASGHSIGVSMLALCLLNGEILNNRKHPEGILGENIYDFLKQQAFDKFLPPVNQKLTFIKSCRFLDPRFTPTGIVTAGHLWRLGAMLTHTDFSDRLPFKTDACNLLKRNTRGRLQQLAQAVKSRGHGIFAAKIEAFLSQNVKSGPELSSTKRYQRLMADEVATAIEDGKPLRLGVLPQPGQRRSCYIGIFISEEEGPWEENVPAYVFTASREKKDDSEGRLVVDLKRHVSLEVECQGSITDFESGKEPRLYTKHGTNGLLFYEGCPRRKVVFPWPAGLRDG
ncbi:heterokaryon incompatibility protein-domain-containing protein [Amylocarpus encephaloides]|uniref:Heterokaryon incompatibility protein-domain-containing protein n=1 Tax=Amylocarpus encephaloides TaxID=45428 RepID=A0A9P7YDS6_9HELO|nr:heterokaryon incompatibility protein-domain-containing protein [Amylocarpus encephaloides]